MDRHCDALLCGALVPDSETDLAQPLLAPALVDELHGLLWTEPFLHRGARDDGWSSRDHAVVVAELLRALGAEEMRVCHGRCMFVQGPGADGAPPVGIGQEGDSKVGHTWLSVDGFGDVDLSPRLTTSQPPWRPVDSPGVVGSAWRAGRATRFTMTTKLVDYQAAIARATGTTDGLDAVYLMERSEPLTAKLAAAGLSWCSSRVSARLLGRGLPDDLYARCAAHLLGVGSGQRRALRGISHNKAWAIIAGDPDLVPARG
jgi:hypothetical protein